MSDEIKRIAEALERIANAQEAQVMIFQALLVEDKPAPGAPQQIMTHSGLVEFREGLKFART